VQVPRQILALKKLLNVSMQLAPLA
jgi:hypothetical protein